MLTRAVDPTSRPLDAPGSLHIPSEYAYQVYDQDEHSGIGMTPQAAYLWGMKQGESESIAAFLR